jgi:Prenyltransferase and squalene oxidase repeat
MHLIRRTLLGASAVGLATLLTSATLMSITAPVGAASVSPQIPQFAAAQAAANWIITQQAADGSISGSLSDTANGILALVAAHDTAAAQSALTNMEANVNAFIPSTGADGPGQLALLILDAHAMNVDPTNFGGTNLPARLLATEQTSGPDAGLFGTEAQLTNFAAGGFDQGMALVALKAVGETANAAAISWLTGQQCPDGGWLVQSQASTTEGCTVDSANFTGPDTNSTSLALQGLAAQGALTPTIEANAISYLTNGQVGDGGWSLYPNSAAQPQQSDAESTALVIQAILALGLSPTSSAFTSSGRSPVNALLSFVVTSGGGAGGIEFQPGDGADILSTNQVTPILAGLTYGFGPTNSYWVVTSTASVHPFGSAKTFGSLTTLNKPIVGMAPTLNGLGYWLVASDGGIFSFGNAAFLGSRGGQPLNKPIVGMAATPDGGGYWLVASDGGIFSYGDAAFYGSRGGQPLNKPIVGMAATPTGGGYWLVASDGGIFSYGDAVFQGSTGGIKLNQPIVGMTGTRDGGGYWLIASDGGVFNYGDALFSGSAASLPAKNAAVGGASSSS